MATHFVPFVASSVLGCKGLFISRKGLAIRAKSYQTLSLFLVKIPSFLDGLAGNYDVSQ